MNLKQTKNCIYLKAEHSSDSTPISVAVSFIVILIFFSTGCNNSSQDTNDIVSKSSLNSGDTIKGEQTLPDLYSGIGESPISREMNPVCLDGHNPFIPFPSDFFAYRDETSSTGIRLKIENSQFPPEIKEILEKIPENVQMDQLYKEPDGSDVDGFTISTNVLFEFDREVDPAWVCDVDENSARDGDDTFYLMDLTTGEFIPALSKESHYAKDPHRETRDYVMQVMARKRFEHGRRYLAFVTKNFKDKNGNDFSCSTGFLKAKSQDGSEVSEFYEPWLKYLESEKGIDRDDILSATIFTTRSRESSLGPLMDMFKTVLADDFTDDHVKIENNMYFPYLFFERLIWGKINMRDFRDENGVLNYTPGFKGTRDKEVADWVPFLLYIPHNSFPKPYPVNIGGTGIVMSKEMMIPIAMANASLGVATISIDWPSHWTRVMSEGWNVLEGVGFLPGGIKKDAADMPRLLSMFMQIPIDAMSTYRALKTYFATSDKKGIRDLDTENLSYSGFSLGVLGGTAAATCMPDLKGAFMAVASVNFNKLLSSGRFLLGGPSMAMPKGLGGAWYAAAMNAIIAQKSDLFDGLGFADGFRNGIPEMGAGPRPLVATYARNDGWVTTECGISLMEIAELPLIYSQDDIAPSAYLNDSIHNFLGIGAVNNLAEHENYGMAELTLFSNDLKLNETIEKLGIPKLVYSLTGHDWYDLSGTLEHASNAMSLAGIYYMMNFINNVQCGGNADDLYAAGKDFEDLVVKGKSSWKN